MTTKLWVFATLLSACTINGKSFGPSVGGGGGGGGGTSSENAAPEGVPTSSMTNGERWHMGAPDEGANTGLPPYPKAPADPWGAVRGDQPLARPRDSWTTRSTPGDCTGAHDHCLESDTWFLVWQENVGRRDRLAYGRVTIFGPSGPGAADGAGDYTMYRTVPATRSNMVPGALSSASRVHRPFPIARPMRRTLAGRSASSSRSTPTSACTRSRDTRTR